jgi:hypothetical protein
VDNFKPSPFDKLRAGSAGLILVGRIPNTACWAKFSIPSGPVPICPDGWFVFNNSVQSRPIGRFGSDELGSFPIILAQEEIEVAALIGLQYGVLK